MTPYFDRDGIVIFHGRCEDVLPTIDPSTVALLIADPAYGYGQSAQRRSSRAKNDPGHDGDFAMIHGDLEPFVPDHLFRFPRLVLFGANHYADKLPPSPSWLVWDKREDATPDDNADAELIWTNLGGPVRTYRQCWRGFTRAKDALEPHKHLHPTQKPIALMIWLLERYTKPGDLVVDPYMGSGPITKACQLLGRRYIGVELVEAYCATTVNRLAQTVLPFALAS